MLDADTDHRVRYIYLGYTFGICTLYLLSPVLNVCVLSMILFSRGGRRWREQSRHNGRGYVGRNGAIKHEIGKTWCVLARNG